MTTSLARVLLAAVLSFATLAATPGGVPSAAAQVQARPWLGIEIDDGARGVKVKGVREKSPAAAAGLQIGDEVLSLDGVAVRTPADLIEKVQARGVGTKVKLRLLRAGAEQDLELPLAARPDEAQLLRDHLVDQPARATQLTAVADGKVVDLAKLKGQVVVVEFFATWCGPCRASMPRLAAWQKTYGAQGLRVIGVSSEEQAVLTGFNAKKKLPYPLARDADAVVAAGWGILAVPTIVIIDRDGVVRFAEIGAGGELDAAEALFKKLLAAKPASP